MSVKLSCFAGAGWQFFSNVGVPLKNGKIYSYLAGTSTPVATYTTSAGNIAHSNPIVLDSSGRVPTGEIWVTPQQNYKFVLKDESDLLIATYDNIPAVNDLGSAADIPYLPPFVGARTSNYSVADKLAQAVSVQDFGAVGDGVTDDTLAIQKAINEANVVYFPLGKTYVVSNITLTQNVTFLGYGATMLHKINASAGGVGMVYILGDYNLTVYGMKFDGNAQNQSAAFATYNFIWCSIGSLEMYDCWAGNTVGHCIRTGNIDDFDASKYAHDVVIQNCTIIQDTATNSCGDSLRIERTRGDNLFSNNYVYGGLSGMRSQLYCKNLKFYNNEVCYAWADVGITVSMGENFEIVGNYCHHNVNHGYEIDAVVSCRNTNNYAYKNQQSGFFASELGAAIYTNSPIFWGSIADGYGTDYSNQTYSSPLVPNINTVHMYNVSIENAKADRLVGLDSDVYAYNYAKGNGTASTGTGDQGQLGIEGGTGLRSSNFIFNNIFVPRSGDAQAIYIYNYQQDATVSGNRVIGNVKLMALAANGMWDANRENRFLQDPSKHSILLDSVNDSKSITGFALTDTPSGGSSTYEFKGVYAGGGGEKWIRFVARSAVASTVTVAVNLYLDNVFVITVVPGTPWNLTTDYTEFNLRIPTSTSVGNQIWPQITNPDGNTIYIQEMNVYLAVGE